MRNIKKFNPASSADGYVINNLPFICSVIEPGKKRQDLYCKAKDKRIIIDENNNASIVNIDSYDGLKFKSNGSTTISLHNGNSPDIKYSLNRGYTWEQWNYAAINLSDGDMVYFKGNNPNGFTKTAGYQTANMFVISGNGTIEASGNIMSLIDDGECTTLSIPCDYCFYMLFDTCKKLITAPELPATSLRNYCYARMFYKTGIKIAPELPAKNLYNYCYQYMFSHCENLTACSIYATQSAGGSCQWMFYYCTQLNYIKCLLTTNNTSYTSWVEGVAENGTFVKNSNTTFWPTGVNGIPEGWTVQDA